MCMQILVDRGQIDVDERVATYWPEYAQNGKEATTVRQLLLHTAGVVGFDRMWEVVRHDGTGWGDLDEIAAPPGRVGAVVPAGNEAHLPRADDRLAGRLRSSAGSMAGRSGRFFADEVAGPLGLDAWIGLPEDKLARMAHIYDIRLDHLPKPIARRPGGDVGRGPRPRQADRPGVRRQRHGEPARLRREVFNNPEFLAGEVPAGNGIATARSVARCWAMMANDGELDGTRVLSADIVERWGQVISNLPDVAFKELTDSRVAIAARADTRCHARSGHLGNGAMPGLGNRFGPNPNAFGAEGLGGQFGFCDRQPDIAVGYVRSELAAFDVLQAQLTRELYRCAAAQGSRGDHREVFAAVSGSSIAALGAYVRRRFAVPTAPG